LFRSYVTHIDRSAGQGILVLAQLNGDGLDSSIVARETSIVNEESGESPELRDRRCQSPLAAP